jgi:hypothetical protein
MLCFRNALKATVTSKEFMDLIAFRDARDIVMSKDIWKYLFLMCHLLYAPMRVHHLADQKTPAMDNLYFYVLQTNSILPKWLGELDGRTSTFLTKQTITAMSNV